MCHRAGAPGGGHTRHGMVYVGVATFITFVIFELCGESAVEWKVESRAEWNGMEWSVEWIVGWSRLENGKWSVE